MKRMMTMAAAVLLAAGFLAGCGESVDENRPVSQIKEEAARLDRGQLEAKVNACKKAIESRKGEVEKLLAQVKATPLNELLSDKSKALKAELAKAEKAVSNLTAQLQAYQDELSKKAGK